MEYRFTNWSITTKTILNQVKSLYKRAIKITDKKKKTLSPLSYTKNVLLNFNNFATFKYACTTYRILMGLAPAPLSAYIKQKEDNQMIRARARGLHCPAGIDRDFPDGSMCLDVPFSINEVIRSASYPFSYD